jgi:hypothetical protein
MQNYTKEEIDIGKMLWQSYYDSVYGLSYSGEQLPLFDDMREHLKKAWIKTAIEFRSKLFGLYGIKMF